MTHLGHFIKQLRQAKHLSLKEAAGDTCSPSLLSRFENGETNLTANKLFAVLDHIHVSLAEFAELLEDHAPHQQFIAKVLELRDQHETEKMDALYKEQLEQAQKGDRHYHMVNAILTKTHLKAQDETVQLSQEEEQFLYDWLFTIEVWGQQEIELFSICSILLPTSLFVRYTKEMLRKVPPRFFQTPKYHTILLNGFMASVEEDELNHAHFFQEQIVTHFYKERDAYYRILYRWTCGLLLCKTGQIEKGLQEMNEAIQVLDWLGCHRSADYYRIATEDYQQVFSNRP